MSISVIGLNSADVSSERTGDRTQTVSYKSFASRPPTLDTEFDVSAAVIASTGYDIGSPHPRDAASFCNSIKSSCVRRYDSVPPRWEWRTDYTFTSKVDPNQPEGPTTEKDPTKRPPKVSIHVEKWDAPALSGTLIQAAGGANNPEEFRVSGWEDVNGVTFLDNQQIRNSAGDPVVRTVKRSKVVIRWQRFMKPWLWKYQREWPTGFMYTRNKKAFQPAGPFTALFGGNSIPAGQARIEDMKADLSYEFGGCVDVSIEIHVDDDSFVDAFLDQGFFYLNEAGVYEPGGGGAPIQARVRFCDRNGATSQPQMLNGSGRPLGANATPVYRRYQYYQLADWSVAPLGGPGGFFTL